MLVDYSIGFEKLSEDTRSSVKIIESFKIGRAHV